MTTQFPPAKHWINTIGDIALLSLYNCSVGIEFLKRCCSHKSFNSLTNTFYDLILQMTVEFRKDSKLLNVEQLYFYSLELHRCWFLTFLAWFLAGFI